MNDLLKQRIGRLLDSLSDERGYEILDYIEFLDSKYAERSRPGGILAKITETVEDTMRAGKLPIQAISGTMGVVDSAAKIMKGLAAAGQAVVDEAVKAAESASKPGSKQVEKPPEGAIGVGRGDGNDHQTPGGVDGDRVDGPGLAGLNIVAKQAQPFLQQRGVGANPGPDRVGDSDRPRDDARRQRSTRGACCAEEGGPATTGSDTPRCVATEDTRRALSD